MEATGWPGWGRARSTTVKGRGRRTDRGGGGRSRQCLWRDGGGERRKGGARPLVSAGEGEWVVSRPRLERGGSADRGGEGAIGLGVCRVWVEAVPRLRRRDD